MKWFNLSLLLVVITLGVVLMVEPLVLNSLVEEDAHIPEPLPNSLATVQTLAELPAAPVPRPDRLVEAAPVASPPVAVEQVMDKGGEATTEKIEEVSFTEQPLESAPTEAAPQVEPVEAPVPEPVIACYRFGPLQNFDQVAAVGAQILEQELSAEWSEVELPYTEERFWVVLEEANSIEAAREWVSKLDEKGFNDHYLPRAEEEPNLISLGIFKADDRAQRHHRALTQAGFPVTIRAKPTELSRRWITFDMIADEGSTPTAVLSVPGAPDATLESCQQQSVP
ncbi:MAG: hypothetical protein VW985_12865 [Gammaproteobacteria bacterium]